MAHDDARAVSDAAYRFQLALVSNSGISEDSFKKSQEHAKDAFNDIWNSVYPWAATSSDQLQAEAYDKLLDAYKEEFGDPNDPEFVRQMEEGVKQYYEDRRARRNQEPEEDMLDRRLREREDRMRGTKQGS